MSQCLYFYRVSRITDDLPEIINTDRMSFPYYDVRPDDAADWEKEIGMLRTIEYGFMDIYEAGEKLFGERPLNVRPSQSYYSNPKGSDAEVEMTFPDGNKQRVHRSAIEEYRCNKQYRAYIYKRDDIVRVEDGYAVNSKEYEARPLSREDLLEMARTIVRDHENDYDKSFGAVPLFEIMKAYFTVGDDDCIICLSE